jgi:tight adherence protein C
MQETVLIVVLIWVGIFIVTGWIIAREMRLRRVRGRVSSQQQTESPNENTRNFVGWWLYRAGFRNPNATLIFLLLFFTLASLAITVAWLTINSDLVRTGTEMLYAIPGGVGEVFLPLAWSAPWLGSMAIAAMPILWIRAKRRRRILQVEQDLPVTLDLLATLAQSGMGFDSALDRILQSQPSNRPLVEDFRIFQIDVLAGRQRVEALRRLMARVDVAWFSIFISAVIHAEQIGTGLAETLRVQAEDLRNRRRERVLALTMSMPVKLVLPLVICFLPGILLAAVGPTIFQMLQVIDRANIQQGITN